MEQENVTIKNKKWGKMNKGDAPAGIIYVLGLIGAAIYYLHNVDTIMAGVVGVLKAFAWPAFVVYKLFEYFGL